MRRRHRISLAVLLVVLLLTLCLFSPTIADSTSTSKKKTSATSAPSSSTTTTFSPANSPANAPPPSSATDGSTTAAATATSTATDDSASAASAAAAASTSSGPSSAQQQRLERKQKRSEAARKRSEQQTKRVADKARRLTKKYSEQRKKRQDRDDKRQARLQKARERTEAYWTSRKAAVQPANREKATQRLRKISDAAASTPLIQLKERQFEEFVVGSPRPYWTLVSLTALSKKYECKICELAHNAFSQLAPIVVAYSAALTNSSDSPLVSGDYNTLLPFNSSVPSAQREQLQRDQDERAKRDLPIFVVELDIDSARNVFNVLQLTTAPVIFLLPPSFAPKAVGAMSNLLTGLNGRYKFVPQSLDLSARTFVDFINQHVDNKLSVAPSGGAAGFEGVSGVLKFIRNKISGFQPVILIYFSIILASLVLFLLVSLGSFYWNKRASRTLAAGTDGTTASATSSDVKVVDDVNSSSLLAYFLPSSTVNAYNLSASSIASLNFYQLPRLLRTLPLIVAGITFYLFCVSGGMFTIIKDTDSGYSLGPSGKLNFKDWISNQYMDQTVIESTVLATLYLTLATLFVLLNSRTFHRPSGASFFSPSSLAGWLGSWLVSPLWIVLAAVFVYLQLVNVYGKKNNYQWGVNWRWLRQIDWQKTIPSPLFHRYLRMVWKEVQNRLI